MGLRDMANDQPYDIHRELEAVKQQQEAHGAQIRANTVALDEVRAEVRAHGLDAAKLTGTVETGFRAMDRKLDIVIDYSQRQGPLSRLVDRLDNRTIIVVALIVGAVALIGFGGASAFRAGVGDVLSIGVSASEQSPVERPAP